MYFKKLLGKMWNDLKESRKYFTKEALGFTFFVTIFYNGGIILLFEGLNSMNRFKIYGGFFLAITGLLPVFWLLMDVDNVKYLFSEQE